MAEQRQHRNDPSEHGLLLLAEVAHLYYVKNLTQRHIAERIGVSRSKVSRMLREARSRGLVEIRIHSPLVLDTDLQDALKARLGLPECLGWAALAAIPRFGRDGAGSRGRPDAATLVGVCLAV